MSTASIDKKIAGYVEQLNAKQKKVVLSVAKAFAEESTDNDIWEDESFVKELDRRTAEYESGKVKGSSWEEVKKKTRKALLDMKHK